MNHTLHLKFLPKIGRCFYLIPLLVALLLFGCKKKDDEPKMPAQTQTGADILACKVNGKVHIYQGKGTYLHDDGVEYKHRVNGNDSSTQIQADDDKTYHDKIVIVIHTFHVEIGKTYSFATETSEGGATYILNNSFYTAGFNSGSVIFTRCDENIASGNFSFTATDSEGNKVEITEGVFDIKR